MRLRTGEVVAYRVKVMPAKQRRDDGYDEQVESGYDDDDNDN